MQGLLGQDRWNKVSNPNKSSTSLDIFGEAYYKMPINFFGINAKSLKQEIRLPNEKGEEEIFILTPTQLLSKSLSAKYPNIKTFKGIRFSQSIKRLFKNARN